MRRGIHLRDSCWAMLNSHALRVWQELIMINQGLVWAKSVQSLLVDIGLNGSPDQSKFNTNVQNRRDKDGILKQVSSIDNRSIRPGIELTMISSIYEERWSLDFLNIGSLCNCY
jgi:hypothetical protein